MTPTGYRVSVRLQNAERAPRQHLVFDMEGSWQLPPIVEPLFENLEASVLLTPVMNGEDLEQGFKEAGI